MDALNQTLDRAQPEGEISDEEEEKGYKFKTMFSDVDLQGPPKKQAKAIAQLEEELRYA